MLIIEFIVSVGFGMQMYDYFLNRKNKMPIIIRKFKIIVSDSDIIYTKYKNRLRFLCHLQMPSRKRKRIRWGKSPPRFSRLRRLPLPPLRGAAPQRPVRK
jgi:hypothetical protein